MTLKKKKKTQGKTRKIFPTLFNIKKYLISKLITPTTQFNIYVSMILLHLRFTI